MEEARTVGDDVQEDLDLCRECAGTWKVACYGAWCPNSQFWEDFLEDGWEDGAYTPRACCLRFMCGLLFWLFAPIWCCKAILFFLFWPCICCCRAARKGHCNRDYFRRRRSKDKRNSQPLAYIESAPPSHPVSCVDPWSLCITHRMMPLCDLFVHACPHVYVHTGPCGCVCTAIHGSHTTQP